MGKIWVVILLMISGCSTTEKKSASKNTHCDSWILNDFAQHFAISACNGDTVLYLLNPAEANDTLARFSLDISRDEIAAISTTHVPMFQELNKLDILTGLGYVNYITNPEIQRRLENGQLRAITAADKLNFEVVIDLQPDLLLVYPYGNENYDRYEQAGIRVLPISEYAESHPLGRAEWIKVFGLLAGCYQESVEKFEKIKTEYTHWKQQAMLRSARPLVFTGSFYKGRWSAPGGDSFVAQFITDAGAQYAFSDYPGHENTELDFEVVLKKIGEADLFGKVLHREDSVSRADFMEENQRFRLLNDFSDDQLFYCNSYTSDYFGKGLLEPHLMLRDLYLIFHAQSSDSLKYNYFKPLSQ